MNGNTITIASAVALLLTGVGMASPLKVKTPGTKSQTTIMCPDCKGKITCAVVGDYTIGFDANVENMKTGSSTVAVHLLDKSKKPVTDAKVTAALTMPDHKHSPKSPLTLKHTAHGRYVAPTNLSMSGAWQAEVEVTPSSGDTVKQTFTFSR